MSSYSVTALVLTIKPRHSNAQCYRVIQHEERFNSARSIEGRDLNLTEIISDIGEFSHLIDCHGVCGNNNEISFVTNFLVLHAANAGKFRLNMNFPSLS